MLNRITRVIGIGFAVFWMTFTMLEYWQYHDASRRVVQYFQYSELVLTLLPIGALLVFLFSRFHDHKWIRNFSNGLGLAVLFGLLSLICINAFFYENLASFLSLQEDLTFLITVFGHAAGVYFLILISYSTGRAMHRLFAADQKVGHHSLVFIAIGIMLIVSLLFILGIFGVLYGFVLWPLLLFLLYLSWRSAWHFIQISLLKPVAVLKELSPLGLSLLFLLLIFVTLNFIQVCRPFPTGFDAMTHYVNIAALLQDYHGLVQGHGAYNWSLFMSLGLFLFDKLSITLALSFVGGLLSLFALYRLSRHWLNADYSMLVLLLFYTLPMISWLSYRDMKVDMGLLFFSILIISTFVSWLQPADQPKTEKATKKILKKSKKEAKVQAASADLNQLQSRVSKIVPSVLKEQPHLTLIGILAGFAFGIKFSALIILLALIPAIAYAKGNKLTFTAATLLMLAFTLLARLDAQAALRPLHLWADGLQWLLLIAGTGISIYLWLKQRTGMLKIVRMCLICMVLSGVFLSPWLIKNVVETRSVNISSLISGKHAAPRPGVQQIKQIYQNQQNGN